MSIQFDIAKQIIAETCPNRKLKLENIRLFADIIQPKKYQKGDIILNEGDICNCLFYIEKGFIRQHYLKHDKDVIEHLACEKDVVWCIDSYFNREPTHLMMDAVENSVLWEIPRDIMEELSDANARLQQHFPEITRRAPLTMIASYLQMTLETLSRVRVSIANAESK